MTFTIDNAWVLIAAAGYGKRMNTAIPKPYLPLAGKPVLQHTLARCLSWSDSLRIALVVDPDVLAQHTVPLAFDNRVTVVKGGTERVDSVLNGLSEITNQTASDSAVLVHDAARPLVIKEDVLNLFNTVADARTSGRADGGLLASEVTDTIKESSGETGMSDTANQTTADILKTVPRERLWRAMTPQLFQLDQLIGALKQATDATLSSEQKRLVTDESSAMERAGYRVMLVKGSSDNIKITLPQDLAVAEALLANQRLV